MLMKRITLTIAIGCACLAGSLGAQQPTSDGPYKVLTRARVGGEGGVDYIYADVAGRIAVCDRETRAPLGEIPETGGQGVAVDPKSGHGFSSSNPVTMFDTKTLTVLKKIDVGAARPDGILFDAFNERVYVFSHPTKDATVIDATNGTVVGTIDLGGVPEEAASDGKGTVYVVMQDSAGGVAV